MSELDPLHFADLTMDEWQDALSTIRRIASKLRAQNGRDLEAAADVLTPRLPACNHPQTVMMQTGDGAPVEFCPDCGRNIWIGPIAVSDELPV